jgi:F0F1-type ATP synthase beta subunit
MSKLVFWPKLKHVKISILAKCARYTNSRNKQLCYKALLRTIAFSTTQCISTWRCLTLFSLQAVIVPVGRIALGRILNVVGSIIDPHSQVCHSCQFNNTNQATIDTQFSQVKSNSQNTKQANKT